MTALWTRGRSGLAKVMNSGDEEGQEHTHILMGTVQYGTWQ